jgi:MFS family permease
MTPAVGGGLLAVVAETTAVQMVASMAVLLVPAIAPEVARVLGVPASLVGVQIGVLYVAAMASSLVAGALIRRFGACRTSQVCMALTAAGCLAIAVPHIVTLLLGSLAIGAGYGLPNPTAAHLLARRTPPSRRNLIFSIKQTGVPLGGMAAGLLGPALAVALGWQSPLLFCAISALALAALSQAARAAWDADRIRETGWPRLPLDGIRAVSRSRSLAYLAGSSFFFSAIQLCVMSFMVVLLVEELGVGLVTAGLILAISQVAGVLGRLIWGAVADRVGEGTIVLAGLAAVMALANVGIALAASGLPLVVVGGLFAVLGLTAAGWNGVFLAEVANRSPASEIAATTGGAMFFTFMGVVVGPASLSLAHGIFGGYALSFLALALAALVGGGLALLARTRAAASNPG